MKLSTTDKNPGNRYWFHEKKEMVYLFTFFYQLFVYLSVMLLNELKPGLKYETGECGGDSPATKRFVISG